MIPSLDVYKRQALGAGVEINTPFDDAVFPVVLAFQVGTVAITEYFYS